MGLSEPYFPIIQLNKPSLWKALCTWFVAAARVLLEVERRAGGGPGSRARGLPSACQRCSGDAQGWAGPATKRRSRKPLMRSCTGWLRHTRFCPNKHLVKLQLPVRRAWGSVAAPPADGPSEAGGGGVKQPSWGSEVAPAAAVINVSASTCRFAAACLVEEQNVSEEIPPDRMVNYRY